VETGLGVWRHPDKVLEAASLAFDGAGMLIGELLKTPDPRSPLKGDFGPRKRVAWSEPVELADVKAIGAICGRRSMTSSSRA